MINTPRRMSLANVIKGRQAKPLRVVVYGVDGVGKSTFASKAPSPIFLCSEDGTSQLDVERLPAPRTYGDILEAFHELLTAPHEYKTLVIDTLDWLEPKIWKQVCVSGDKESIEDFGFGKGYVMALELWRDMLERLDKISRERNMHVVLLAHTEVVRIEDPVTAAFDRFTLKLHKKSAALVREWADAVLFARHEVIVTEATKRNPKAKGESTGHRLMHTQYCAKYDAKNRFDLPETMQLDWQDLADLVARHTPIDTAKDKATLTDLVNQLPDADRLRAGKLIEWAGNNANKLSQAISKVRASLALIDRENTLKASDSLTHGDAA